MMQIANIGAGQDIEGLELVKQGVDQRGIFLRIDLDRLGRDARAAASPAPSGSASAPLKKKAIRRMTMTNPNNRVIAIVLALVLAAGSAGAALFATERGDEPGKGRRRVQAGLLARPRREVDGRKDGHGRGRPPVPEQRLGGRRPLLVLLRHGEDQPVPGSRFQVLSEVPRREPRQRVGRRGQVQHDPHRPGAWPRTGKPEYQTDHRVL